MASKINKGEILAKFFDDGEYTALFADGAVSAACGYAAGQQAYDILVNGADPATTPIFFFDVSNLSLVINEENAAALGITIPEALK